MGKFSEYIGSQFGNPRGFIGKVCCLLMNTINRGMYSSISSCINQNEDSTILDIGYGNGYLINKMYKKTHATIYGVDVSDDMKKQQKIRIVKLSIIKRLICLLVIVVIYYIQIKYLMS